MCWVILKSMHKYRSNGSDSSIYDHFIVWPQVWPRHWTYLNKWFKWYFYSWGRTIGPRYFKIKIWIPGFDNFVSHTARTNVSNDNFALRGEQLCQFFCKKSMHKCRSNGSDKLNLNHFNVWPSSVTVNFNLPEQMFQMALLLLKENNCAKSFKNAAISVARNSEIGSIKSQTSSKTSRRKKDCTKRHHQSHHQRQPGEQLFLIQVVTG